ncbi:NADPH--cytochrome P450 reductase [Ceratocystis lukuohia]|uniref:NADPH--cytochrome P450 reductase n=1 Tax=Ceratocystis lukuohia TaxID=2019550 RepID=A0ABR4M982_9PEZI
MAELDVLDLVVLATILFGTVAYITKGKLWAKADDPYANAINTSTARSEKTRNIVEKLEESGKNCIIFFGSQTGTAEDYASRLAKEGKSRFGLDTMVADLEDYDFDNLDAVPSDKIVMFVLATYGEGEPTDNAVDFHEFLKDENVEFSEGTTPALDNLNYVIFGLGNNTYEHYNLMVRHVNKLLESHGAHRISEAGEGDDGAGTMEEDFIAWKESMWKALADKMGLQEREAVYEPVFSITKCNELSTQDEKVYLGEPNGPHRDGTAKGPYNAHNPYISPISEARELFNSEDRSCLHMEIDISGSSLHYETGDHVAVWPSNPSVEVDRFLDLLDLTDKRNEVIDVKPVELTAKVPFPTPTTYDAIVRYHMEICAPVSRQFVGTLAAFAPNPEAKAEMAKLGGDKDYFHSKTHSQYFNIARLLSHVSGGEKWDKIPFSAFIEGLTKLQPRYYSISSSSEVQPKSISITAVVESFAVPGRKENDFFSGVTTNYLAAISDQKNNAENASQSACNYEVDGPRGKYAGAHVPIHVRHSNFKMPSNPSKPIICIGPGTGVAPMRAFIQERAHQAKNGNDIGRTILFFGCRNRNEDFLYEKEWEEYKEIMGDKFELVTAFSREGATKVYVQHRLKERSAEINELLLQKANIYVCGDAANMAREVNVVLTQIISEQRGIPEAKAEEIIKGMRSSSQYQEDVWS